MANFKRKSAGGSPGISTASLPDIIFMLLFFFMVTTVMREVSLKVQVKLPKANERTKLERKDLVSYIYIGKPTKSYEDILGSEPRIQLNDEFKEVSDIQEFIVAEREQKDEVERTLMTTSLKVDENVKMKLITEIKQELRKVSALKINYSSLEKMK